MCQRVLFVAAAFCLLCPQYAAAETEWPQFRGPDGQGHVATGAPLEWSEDSGVVWKTAIPGRGWSSPVVEGDRIWMTSAVEHAADPEELKERTKGSSTANAMELAADVSLRVVCVDRKTGQLLHDQEVLHVAEPDPIHSLNSYASPTPVVEPGRLYCHFGCYGTVCLDTSDLSTVWEREFPIDHMVGPGSSPVMCGDLLVLTCDGGDLQYVVAVDKNTGKTVWKKDRPPLRATNPDFKKSYCTPLVIEENGEKQIVIPGAQWIIAYAPEDGREVWTFDHGSGFSLVPRPVVDDKHIYCCTGFAGDRLLAINRGGSGDVTKSHIDWYHGKQVPNQPSPVLYDGRLFMVSDNGIGQCLETSTGQVIWKKRLEGNYSASPLLVGERVYFFSREGTALVIDANSADGDVLATNELDGGYMATPAVVDGRLIVRTESDLYLIGD